MKCCTDRCIPLKPKVAAHIKCSYLVDPDLAPDLFEGFDSGTKRVSRTPLVSLRILLAQHPLHRYRGLASRSSGFAEAHAAISSRSSRRKIPTGARNLTYYRLLTPQHPKLMVVHRLRRRCQRLMIGPRPEAPFPSLMILAHISLAILIITATFRQTIHNSQIATIRHMHAGMFCSKQYFMVRTSTDRTACPPER